MKQRKNDRKDQFILQRFAKMLNAEVGWSRSKNSLDITVTAPPGFVWACCGEDKLTHQSELPYTSEVVADLILSMSDGFKSNRKARHNHESTCECDKCERSDSEVEEVRF